MAQQKSAPNLANGNVLRDMNYEKPSIEKQTYAKERRLTCLRAFVCLNNKGFPLPSLPRLLFQMVSHFLALKILSRFQRDTGSPWRKNAGAQ